MVDERQRAASRRQTEDVDIVLECDRNAVERLRKRPAARSASKVLASAIARGLSASIARSAGPLRSYTVSRCR
jgi:hypothetical protein